MRPIRPRLIAHLRFRAAAYLVLLIALLPTTFAYWRVFQSVRTRDQARFDTVMSHAEKIVRDNVESLAADLLAVSGFFEASTNVRPEEWNAFVARLDLDRRHPGIRSVGFSERVHATERAEFLARVRPYTGTNYAIFPPSDAPLMFPTVYVTQYPTNIDSRLGWDSYSDAHRRDAINTVLRTGQPAATGKVGFWNANAKETEGFTILAPVIRTDTNGGAKKELKGLVFSSFIPQHLFNTFSNSALAGLIRVQLFDGTSSEPKDRLASFGDDASSHPSFDATTAIRVLDRVFLLQVTTLPAFDSYSEKHLPAAVLACSLGFSFLLFSITWMQGTARSATEKLNRRLLESEEQLRSTNAELERKIAEARQTEVLLAHERDLLNMLLNHSPDRIYFKDRESRFIKCGKSILDRLGQAGHVDATGKKDSDFFTEEHSRNAFTIEQEIIRTGRPVIGLVEKETWLDGRESWVLTSKMPLRDKHGNIIGTFGISKDISELKAAELALAKEKELLGVTLRSIGEGVITTDVTGRIVLFNHVAEQLTGWSQEDAIGRQLTEVFRTKGDETDSEMMSRALDATLVQPSRDAVLVMRTGAERSIAQTEAPIIDNGNRLGTVLVFRDITEKLQTEAELLKASKLESIGVLAGGIAHDFNNILTVILGNISLARLAHTAGLSASDSLGEAEKASLRARELTQRLLTFAKGGAPIKRPVSLVPLVRECSVNALRDTAISPEFFFGDDLWPVEADEAQITQVLLNLIGHARASTNKDPRLDIHVFNQEIASDPLLLLKPGRYVRVSIRDYGSGIQPENVTKIFEPYFGAKRQGSGLELATAYSIVRKHDGQIRVESISGQGTVFHVYLPASLSPFAMAARTVTPGHSRIFPGPKRVLVMDDELPIRKLSVLLLERLGCTVETAADGAEAIEIYESARAGGEPFDVVIMDLTIPNGMGGKEAIRRLKAIDPNAIAIVSSGYSNDPVMANFRDHGFAGVVPKPYSSEDLGAAIAELFPSSPH